MTKSRQKSKGNQYSEEGNSPAFYVVCFFLFFNDSSSKEVGGKSAPLCRAIKTLIEIPSPTRLKAERQSPGQPW